LVDDDLDGLRGKEMERAKLGAMPPPIELAGVCLRRACSLLIKRRAEAELAGARWCVRR
jgi:hypothetical protein